MKKVFYISPYLEDIQENSAFIVPAAQRKVSYLKSVLERTKNVELHMVCIRCSFSTQNSYYTYHCHADQNKTTLHYLPTISSTNKFIRKVNYISIYKALYKFLIKNVNKDDTVILYHSLMYDSPVISAKKRKKFKLIYEIEEIYADVHASKIKNKKHEILMCKTYGDVYLFAANELTPLINADNKPYKIINGAYSLNPYINQEKNGTYFDVVYSGTLMEGKGVDQAIMTAEYLSDKFRIKIIGFGSKSDEARINNLISEISCKTDCRIIYDGFKNEKECDFYLAQCKVGLCTQPIKEGFNQSSFPSKILTYLASGLAVVSTPISAIMESQISNYILFSKSDCPKDIANSIMTAVSQSNNKSLEIIQNLNLSVENFLSRNL